MGTEYRDSNWGGVSTDEYGNVSMGGYTYGSLDGVTPANRDVAPAFVSKLNTSGDLLWTHQFGTDGWDSATALSTHGQDTVYVSGFTQVDPGDPDAGFDAFITKIVPEPSAFLLAVFGVLSLIARGRRQPTRR